MQSSRPLPFQRIGKYRLIEHIATGGMGAVYKAFDEDNQRTVALKVLPPEMAANPTLVQRFKREAEHAAHLKHKNIVTLYESGEQEGVLFLAMEFIDGIDLAEYIQRRGRVDPEEARRIVMQTCKALQHAFDQGITHRDIKPSNFLLANIDGRTRVKMADMGLSRNTTDEEYRVTRAGTTVGTVDYMAPEQARDSASADIRSDIYSLGCTLYHMLAGHPPFNEGGIGERVYKHLAADPPDIRMINRAVPDALWTVLRRMLAKHPDDRFQTPGELFEALRSLDDRPPSDDAQETTTQAQAPTVAVPSPVPTSTRPPSSREVSAPEPAKAPRPHSSRSRKHRRRSTKPEQASRGPMPADALPITPEQRQAAAGQFERAKQLQGSEDPDYALQLLLSCCKLDPVKQDYRKVLREVGQAAARGRSRWLGSLTVLPLRNRFRTARLAGDHRKVLELGEEILLRVPGDVSVQLDMSSSAETLGLHSLAVWLLEQARQQDPASLPVLKALAGLYERLRRFPQAIAMWDKIRERDPFDLEAGQKIKDLAASDTIARTNQRR
jgi:serine/threonine protein kinase